MAKHVFNAHFVGSRISWSREQAQAKKGPCGSTKSAKMEKSSSPKRSPARGLKVGNQPLFILNQRTNQRPLQENQAFEDELGAVSSVFRHPLPNMNIDQGLSYQLKSKELWNSIIFPKTAPSTEGELKPNYTNSNKLML